LNEFIAGLLNRPRPQKLGILMGVVLFLVIVGYFYVYLPGNEQLNKLNEDLAGIRGERDRKKVIAANLPKLQRDIQEWTLKLKAAASQLPDTKEIPDLLSNLSAKAREAGLEIILFRPRPENFQDFYAEIPIDIIVRGNFYSALRFFDSVGKLNRPVNIDNIDLRNPKITGDQVELEISTLATTYRFLDEADRKKAADEKAKTQKK
jgi:type IV pilus assembly protein PilO